MNKCADHNSGGEGKLDPGVDGVVDGALGVVGNDRVAAGADDMGFGGSSVGGGERREDEEPAG